MRKYLDEITYEETRFLRSFRESPPLLVRLIEQKSREIGSSLHLIDEYLTSNVPLVKDIRKYRIPIIANGTGIANSKALFLHLSDSYIEKQVIPYLNHPENWVLGNFEYLYNLYKYDANSYFARRLLELGIEKANNDSEYRESFIDNFREYKKQPLIYAETEKDLYFIEKFLN